MKWRTFRFLLALILTLGSGLAAQEAPSTQQMTEIMTKYATPGEHHRHLESMIGTWTTRSTFWTAPGAPQLESTGKARHSH